MLILLSPAKTLDFSPPATQTHTVPDALDQSEVLIEKLRDFSPDDVSALMKVSEKIATLNVQRYQDFSTPFSLDGSTKQALLAFKGDVYRDWPLAQYNEDDFAYAQAHLRILSGLYGALRPMDLIQAYRLEMGTRLKTERGKNLVQFWGDRITNHLNEALAAQGDDLVVNLASVEYFNSVKVDKLKGRVVSPVFQEKKGDDYKIVAIHAKKARGAMAHYLIKNRVESLEELCAFVGSHYQYDETVSTPLRPVFRRDMQGGRG